MSRKDGLFSIEGMEDFSVVQDLLKDLPQEETDKFYKSTLRKGAKMAQEEIEKEATNDQGSKAKGSVKIEKDKDSDLGFNIGIKEQFYYYRFLIYGTEQRETDAGINRGTLKSGNNFVLKALDKSIPEIEKFFFENWAKEIDKKVTSKNKSISKKLSK